MLSAAPKIPSGAPSAKSDRNRTTSSRESYRHVTPASRGRPRPRASFIFWWLLRLRAFQFWLWRWRSRPRRPYRFTRNSVPLITANPGSGHGAGDHPLPCPPAGHVPAARHGAAPKPCVGFGMIHALWPPIANGCSGAERAGTAAKAERPLSDPSGDLRGSRQQRRPRAEERTRSRGRGAGVAVGAISTR